MISLPAFVKDVARNCATYNNLLVLGIRGIVKKTLRDTKATLHSLTTIVGRAFVLHAGIDDLGLKSDQGSKTTGNAGMFKRQKDYNIRSSISFSLGIVRDIVPPIIHIQCVQ